jgi:hypothetical protein
MVAKLSVLPASLLNHAATRFGLSQSERGLRELLNAISARHQGPNEGEIVNTRKNHAAH